MLQLAHLIPQFNVENLLHYLQPVHNGRIRLPFCVRVPHGVLKLCSSVNGDYLQPTGCGGSDCLVKAMGDFDFGVRCGGRRELAGGNG